MRKRFSQILVMLAVVSMVVTSCTKKDTAVPVSGVTLNLSTLSVSVGATAQLTATVAPENADTKTVVWSSSDITVAAVDNSGMVVGVKIGSATITATTTDGGKTATCAVTVTQSGISVTGVTLSSSTLSVKVGEQKTLTATIAPTNATLQTVAWSSSDISVAAVGNDGKVLGVKIGTATITVTSTDGAKTATCAVTVIQAGNMAILKGEIKGTRNLVKDSVYLIQGFTYVVDGATLNIAPGTLIKGDKPTMGSLIIERGGKINAIGTAALPIVFTSNQPIGARTYGDWGGVILCGKATVNQTGGTSQVEGGPRSIYGGGTTPNDADNSGTLKYVRIEFAGYPFQPDKEINGLTFCGVGSGTTIDYIQVSYANDDSYEWFGGAVNCKHLIAFRGLDDEFDTDNGFSGKVQFIIGMRDPRKADVSGSNGFESDNDAAGSGNTPITNPIFSNVTMIGPLKDSTVQTAYSSDFKRAMHIRRNSKLCCFNSVVAGWPVGIYIDGSTTWANAQAGDLVLKNCAVIGMQTNFAVPSGSSYTATDVQTWFMDATRGNATYTGPKQAGIYGNFLTANESVAPILQPSAGSPLLSGASFTDTKLNNPFFTVVTYKGAFDGTNDWTSGWANWNPQQTAY